MHVDQFVLCDFANETRDGKLNIIGVFDSIGLGRFPGRHRHFCIVLRLRTTHDDSEKQRKLRITLKDPHGKNLFEVQGELGFATIPEGTFAHHNQIMNVGNITFKESGEYQLLLRIDNELISEKPLRVIKRG